MTQKLKQIVIVVVIIAVAFVVFKVFFSKDSGSDTLSVTPPNSAEFIDGQAILALLNKLDRVKLDTAIFTDKVFLSLTSFERPIKDQITGRKNPFAPIGAEI